MKNQFFTKRLALVVAITFIGMIITGFTYFDNKEHPNTQNGITTKQKTTIAEDAFRSIFFSQGKLAQELPLLNTGSRPQFNPNAEKEYNDLVNEILTYITDKNPDFFLSFYDALHSQDSYTIDHTLEKAHKLFKEAGQYTLLAHFDTYLQRKNIIISAKDLASVKQLIKDKDFASLRTFCEKNLSISLTKNTTLNSTEALCFDIVAIIALAIDIAAVTHIVAVVTETVFWSTGPEPVQGHMMFSKKHSLKQDELVAQLTKKFNRIYSLG